MRLIFAILCLLPAVAATAQMTERPAASVVAIRSVAQPHAETLTLRGATEAERQVDVRAEIDGLVASAPPRRGARVAEGEVLCQIAPGERPANLAEAEAELRQAQVAYDAATRLSERGFTAETEALTRAAQLEAARAEVMRAELAIDRLTVKAPFAGVLESDAAELGELLQPGSVCATLIDLDPITLVAYAAESDVDRLETGMTATARLASGREIAGDVRFVARSADPGTRTYRVDVEAPNPDLEIRDGMTALIKVGLAARQAHFAPQSALTLDDEGRVGVRIVEDGVARFSPVSIISDATSGVWLAGLPDEAAIITVGQEYVSTGSPVDPTWAEPPAPPAQGLAVESATR